MSTPNLPRLLAATVMAGVLVSPTALIGAPKVSRLSPPSGLFSYGDPNPPIIARFLPGQRFDLQATVQPDTGQTIAKIEFLVDGTAVGGSVTLVPATVSGLPAGTTVGTRRAYSHTMPGVRILTVRATQSNGAIASAQGNLEIVNLGAAAPNFTQARNIIVMVGDGMGVAHRTAARIMVNGVSQGKALAPLAMDRFPVTGLVSTFAFNSIITDSAPGGCSHASGNKAHNDQLGVFPDDTTDKFDNPRVELMGEYLARTLGKSLGIVTTADVADATPAGWQIHTQDRGAGTGICDRYLDEAAPKANLTVLLGGGRKWFLPASTSGSVRSDSNGCVLPDELAAGWGVAKGALNRERDLLAAFQAAGFTYVATAAQLKSVTPNIPRLLGLFTLGHMNVALDRINGRRGTSTVVNDYGFPDQPMLFEMADKALQVLNRNPSGFVLMIEGACIDKQAHAMDSERWLLDTIEFDWAVERVHQFILANPDTLAVVTADHETGGVAVIGASRLTDAALKAAGSGTTVAQLRNNLVGTDDNAGFPFYKILADGFPETTDVDRRLLIGYGANADRTENWQTNPKPLRDSSHPFSGQPPISTYPANALTRYTTGGLTITGQVPGSSSVHTATDVPLSAAGAGANLFSGTMDNTDVFFRAMQAALVGSAGSLPPPAVGQRTAADRLVNVSTRGFVGTGPQALICGFVIDGTQPRTLLIRAVGPALAYWGLGGLLADPVLWVVNSTGNVVFTNDNWETNTNLVALRGATDLVGSWALPAGSKDAATLVTLPPGSYTVQVAGVGGTTGLALVEVYETP
jgi:alkaline phosphatase